MASKKLSTDTSLANSYKLSRGVASVARPSAPTIGTATDGGTGNMSVTFTANTLGPTASSFSLTSSSGVTGSGASSPLTLQEAVVGTYTYSVSGVNANGTGPSSAASNSVVVASVFAPSGAFDSIATTTLATATSTITFSSIPATYTHLQLRGIARTSVGGNSDFVVVRFNSDSGANYSRHAVVGPGGSIYLEAAANATSVRFDPAAASGAISNVFGVGIVDILDYANTSKYKTTRNLSGFDNNGTGTNAWDKGFIQSASGNWRSTSAISTITLTSGNGGNFAQYTQFALYGIKGA